MKDNSNITKDGVRVRRTVYFPIDLARRLDGLTARGATTSGVISVALRQSLPTIEKKYETEKTTRARKTK